MQDFDFEMDWSLSDTATNDAGSTQPMPAVIIAESSDGWDTGVVEASAKLVESERDIVRSLGFAHDDSKLFYQAGTALANVGIAKTHEFAAEYDAMETLAAAATRHAMVIQNEQRAERVMHPAEWRLDINGKLYNTTDTALCATLSDTAWSQLGQQQTEIVVPPGANGDAQRAAMGAPRGNVNAWIGQVPQKNQRKARVRTHGGSRQIFALVSAGKRGYTAYDSDRAIAELARILPDGTKCTAEYDSDTTRLKVRAILQAPYEIEAFTGVGRIHQAGIQFVTRDDGMMSLVGRAFLIRLRCKNASLTQEKLGEIRRKHTGTYEQLAAQITLLAGRIPELMHALKSLWSRAAAEHYLDSETGVKLDAPEAIARLVAAGHISDGGLSTDDAIAAYVAAWRAEDSPHSAAGVIMAIQRAAHEMTWRTSWSQDTIEEQASAMLHQHVYTLDKREE